MLTPEQEYNSAVAYLIFPEEYGKYYSSATWTGEEVMSYSLWLERYKRVCPEDTRMLIGLRKKQLIK